MSATAAIKDYINTPGSVVDSEIGFSCIDGRSTEGGNLKRPGGHWGYIEILLALKPKYRISVQDCVNLVFNAVTSDGRKFYMHTDEHTLHEKPHDMGVIGCGHIANAIRPKHGSEYGVNPDDVKEALIYSRTLDKFQVIEESLEGTHKESGIIRVRGTKKTVVPQNANSMYFIYDMERDEEFMKGLAATLKKDERLKDLTFEEFKEISDKQLNATSKILAKGKPIFDINADLENPNISFAGKV